MACWDLPCRVIRTRSVVVVVVVIVVVIVVVVVFVVFVVVVVVEELCFYIAGEARDFRQTSLPDRKASPHPPSKQCESRRLATCSKLRSIAGKTDIRISCQACFSRLRRTTTAQTYHWCT